MKKCFYLVIMMLVSISANADDYFKHGGIRYKIESFVDQELCVTYPDESDYTTTNLVIPSSVRTKQGQVWTVTAIGEDAFSKFSWESGYKNLRSVTIPKTVKRIHKQAFQDATISEVTADCPTYIFRSNGKDCSLINNMKVLHLGANANEKTIDCLSHFKSIEKITLVPTNKNLSFEKGIIYNKAKTKIYYCVRYVNSIPGATPVTIPRSVKEINFQAFDFKGLNTINHNSSAITQYKYDVKQINFGDAVTKEAAKEAISNIVDREHTIVTLSPKNPYLIMEDGVLYDKDKTEILFISRDKSGSLVMPETVRRINRGAISYNKLTSITFSRKCKGSDAYINNCNSLQSIIFPDSVEVMGDPNGSKVDHVDVWYLPSLTTIKMPKYVKKIISYAFEGIGIKELELPNGLESIEDNAFLNCKELTKVVLPETLTSVRYGTFRNCVQLKIVYCYAKAPKFQFVPFVWTDPKQRKSNVSEIHVPRGCKAAYENSDWKHGDVKIIDDL